MVQQLRIGLAMQGMWVRSLVKCVYMRTQSCLTLCNPVDCSPPGSSVHGISLARILEWIAISFSRDLPNPEIDQTCTFCLAGGFFATEPPGTVFMCVHIHMYAHIYFFVCVCVGISLSLFNPSINF